MSFSRRRTANPPLHARARFSASEGTERPPQSLFCCVCQHLTLHHSYVRAVPLDSGYLSNSPFMLNVAHAQTGLSTVGLQCKVPQPGSLNTASKIVTGGITVTPAEAAGAPGIKSG